MKKNPTSAAPLQRRSLMAGLAAAIAGATTPTQAQSARPAQPAESATTHKIVYQLNHHEEEHLEAIFNSISALLKKYTDDVAIAVVAWGPGIHVLAKNPKRPVSRLHQQRVRSMAEAYGVKFYACGNTMHTIGWTNEDMVDFATVEEVGAATMMELQEKGHAYLAW